MAWLDILQEIGLSDMFGSGIGKPGLSSVYDIVKAAKGNTYCEFYRVRKGVRDSDIYICYYIASRVEFDMWGKFCELTDCHWPTKYSKRNELIVDYIAKHHSSPTYSIKELDKILEAHGFAKLRERRK